MTRVVAKFIPGILTDHQKEKWKHAEQKQNHNFFSKAITDDELWCYDYDLRQSDSQASGRLQCCPPKKSTREVVKSNIKTMLICFFDIIVVHAEFVPPGPTVNHAFNLKGFVKVAQQCEAENPNL